MLNKNLKSSLLITSLIILASSYSIASQNIKTSSLSIKKIASTSQLPQVCQKLFKEGEKLVSDAEKQPGTHVQVSVMKGRLSISKEKILQMEASMQKRSCDKGLQALNQLKHKY